MEEPTKSFDCHHESFPDLALYMPVNSAFLADVLLDLSAQQHPSSVYSDRNINYMQRACSKLKSKNQGQKWFTLERQLPCANGLFFLDTSFPSRVCACTIATLPPLAGQKCWLSLESTMFIWTASSPSLEDCLLQRHTLLRLFNLFLFPTDPSLLQVCVCTNTWVQQWLH